ncbi:hypothetical protein [Lysinibacillus sp. fls2-241-R2A-57]|uniref:hypothetical protein n=1 Tax=Lysinibacillus sp. fls2-241-R2A-57 TaxID=3040292 RepID=UPI0025523FC8|nr:hypothetical protein [Lysinibacillus sp. fls2-241-R2A-57]
MDTQQDPIGLARNNPTFYGYVGDVNKLVDPCLYLLNIKNILILFLPINHDVIKDILDNPDNIFYHKNNNHLLFYKDGDVVVVSGKDSGIITAYGKSDAAGVYQDIKSITDKPAITQIE